MLKKLYSVELDLNDVQCLGVFSSWKKARSYTIKHCFEFHKEIELENADASMDFSFIEEFYKESYRIVEIDHINLNKLIYFHSLGCDRCGYEYDFTKKIKVSKPKLYLTHSPELKQDDWEVKQRH